MSTYLGNIPDKTNIELYIRCSSLDEHYMVELIHKCRTSEVSGENPTPIGVALLSPSFRVT